MTVLNTSTYQRVPVERQEPPASIAIQPAPVQNRPIPMFNHPIPMTVRPAHIQVRPPPMRTSPAPTQTAPILIQPRPTPSQPRPTPTQPQPNSMTNRPMTRTCQISAMGRVCDIPIPTSPERVIHENESHMSSSERFLCTLCVGTGGQNKFKGRGAFVAHMHLSHGFATGPRWIDQYGCSAQ